MSNNYKGTCVMNINANKRLIKFADKSMLKSILLLLESKIYFFILPGMTEVNQLTFTISTVMDVLIC